MTILHGDRFMSGFDFTFESEPTVVRRLEVISGDVGRRHWPDEVKARIVAESFAPGAVVSVVARRHRLRPQQLFAWRRLAREGQLALPAGAGLEGVAFAPVVMVPPNEDRASPPTEAGGSLNEGTIEIAIGSAVVRVGRGVEGAQLKQVLAALKAVG